jgi:SNF2 family DNA or RNA helicase
MKLRPYQVTAAHWLTGKARAYLADAPRVGKTPAVAEALRLASASVTGALIVCPAVVQAHWRAIMREVAPGVPHEVMSYSKLVLGGEDLRTAMLGQVDISHLVLDEAHHLANAGAKRTRLILGKGGYASRTPVVWALSGTPMWKHVGSLWTVMASLFGKQVAALGIRT